MGFYNFEVIDLRFEIEITRIRVLEFGLVWNLEVAKMPHLRTCTSLVVSVWYGLSVRV